VQAICDFVHGHLAFDYMKARATRTALEAYEERVGVCRDYAHLAITLLPLHEHSGALRERPSRRYRRADPRSDGFFGLDGSLARRPQWVTFDPRNNMPRIGRIVVARGRDAADVPLINSFGPHVMKSFRVWTYDVTGL
jgi:transglutaminase-like putative cysteine protease